jgi:hypothetical protein
MALDTSAGPMNEKKNLFAIGGSLVSATWHQILVLYLYLTVGMPVWIEEREAFSFLPGGYLGVNANITVGLLCLCLVMEYVTRCVRALTYDLDAQAGGDDHAFLIVCDTRDQETIITQIRFHMQQYIGHLKEFDVIDLADLDDGIIPNASFCRKRLKLERGARSIRIKGEHTFPLPVATFPTVEVPTKERQKAWTALDLAFQQYESKVGDPEHLCDAFRAAYLRKYPSVRPIRRYTTKVWRGNAELVIAGGRLMTSAARDIINNVPVISDNMHSALISWEARVRHALSSQLIEPHTVEVSGSVLELLVATSDKPSLLFSYVRTEEWRYPPVVEETMLALNLI